MLHIMGQDPGLEVPSSLLGDSGLSFESCLQERCLQQEFRLGWTSVNVNVRVVAFWEALGMKARSPEKSIDVTYLQFWRC